MAELTAFSVANVDHNRKRDAPLFFSLMYRLAWGYASKSLLNGPRMGVVVLREYFVPN